eukprot:5022798-Amphidinium_carterae.1
MTNEDKWSCAQCGAADNWSRRQVCRVCSAPRGGAAGGKTKGKGKGELSGKSTGKGKGKDTDTSKVAGLLAKLVQQQG